MEADLGLPPGWDVRIGLNGRLYYISKQSQIVQILPPPEYWRCHHSLPYGWEMAADYENKNYYINHISQTVTYEDPRTEDDQTTPSECLPSPDVQVNPQPRECEIIRDSQVGFGFIAGSEKPVIVRSVTPGGPSEGKLLPDDQIIKIGKENVLMADREHVIELIREKSDKVSLTVLQPNRSASSSFLNPAKKTFRAMDRPKVRFADDVIVNGQERVEGSSPLIVSPGVLRVELENKQTRSFRFQPETTAGDAVAALCDKLGFKDPNLFSLVLTPANDDNTRREANRKLPRGSTASELNPISSSSPNSLLIAPWDCLAKVVSNPSVRHHTCNFRLEFMPKDFHKLARNDPEAFKYLYTQCVNDVVSGDVYKNDLSREELVKLAVIQMQELVLSSLPPPMPEKIQKRSSSLGDSSSIPRNHFRYTGLTQKLSLKYIEKEYGLRSFIPPSVIQAMQKDNPTARNIRKSIQQYLKASYSTPFFNQHPSSPLIPTSAILTSGGNADSALLQLRLQYLKTLSPQHLFGGRFFYASMQALMESDITILVGHNYGISQMINAKTKMVSVLAEFHHVTGFEVAPCQAEASTTTVKIDFAEKKELLLTMEPQAAHNFAFMVAGYCRVYGNIDMVLTLPLAESTSAPIYFGAHKVKPSYWNYPSSTDAPIPAYFYCDFSEPITPAILSQQSPLVDTPKKNGYHRPPTPPPVLLYPLDDEKIENERPIPEQVKPENSDSNNNSSLRINADDVTYEEIVTSLPESPVSSLSAGQYSDLSPSNSPVFLQDNFATSNGYLVPTPPSQRAKDVEVRDRKNIDSDGEGDWMELMKALGTNNSNESDGDQKSDINNVVNAKSIHAQKPSEIKAVDEPVRDIIVPPPPSYPPPKRKESVRKEIVNSTDGAVTGGENANLPKSRAFSSFKPSEGETKVFTLTRTDVLTKSPTESEKHIKLDNVDDPVTRQKLQETEDLIEYFRRKREEVVGASNESNASPQENPTFDPSNEFDAPIVVSDLAAGNKRLRKAEKAASKNRKSWAAGDSLTRKLSMEDSGPISMSNPDLSGNMQKKKNRSFFRKLFGGDRKRRSHSMYETYGASSAYGRRKKRFRIPKFRLRRAFTLNSSKRSSKKSTIPTSVSETPTKSSPFRFRPFSSKKPKNHGVLVISEPCDGVRGVDLLPSGKYTVAGTMFLEGEARETEVITLDSKRPSIESLVDDNAQNEGVVASEVISNDVPDGTQEIKLRLNSQKEGPRPISFSTFQQAVLEGYTAGASTTLNSVDEVRRGSFSRGMDQASPCELSLTESSEALQDAAKAAENIHDIGIEETSTEFNSVKPQLVGDNNKIPEFSVKSASLPPGLCLQAALPQATSTPIQLQLSKTIKKRPSHKRPAPPPPIAESTKKAENVASDKAGPLNSARDCQPDPKADESPEELVKSDWEDDNAFKRKSVESPSLMTEIFSILESSTVPSTDELRLSTENLDRASQMPLPYGDGYVMPGVKLDDVRKDEDAPNQHEYENTQKAMYEMFYKEMMEDNSRLILHRNGSVSEQEDLSDNDDDSDSDDSQFDGNKMGSYDVTFSDLTSNDVKEVDINKGEVLLTSYEQIPDDLVYDAQVMTTSTESDVTTSRDTSDSDAMLNKSDSSSPVVSSPEYSNCDFDNKTQRFSYSTYQNLITPPGFQRGLTRPKRMPMGKKPPLPPKPIFH